MKYLFCLLAFLILLNVRAQRWIPKQKLVHENRQSSAQGFGRELVIQNDFVFVGVDGESYDSSTTNPVPASGSVRIYKRDTNGVLSLYQVLHPNPRIPFSKFGNQLFVNNNFLIVGAWEETINDSGYQGAAYIFKLVNNYWYQVAKLVAPDGSRYDYFGSSVAINDGYAIVSARYDNMDSAGNNPVLWAGSAYIFKKITDTNWAFVRKITPSNRDMYTSFFGSQVKMNDSVTIISAHSTNYQGGQLGRTKGCYYYTLQANGIWIETQNIQYKDTSNTGISFGKSISLHGNYLLVGADNDSSVGAVYLYKRVNNLWELKQQIIAPDASIVDHFGMSISLSSIGAIIGAPDEDDDVNGNNSITSAGSVYVYQWHNDSLVFLRKIVAPDRDVNKSRADLFGNSVTMSNDMMVINAWYDDEDAQNENPIHNAGSIYLFDTVCHSFSSILDTTICDDDVLVLNNTNYTDSGYYEVILSSTYGCDSIIQLHLHKTKIDTSVTMQTNALVANASNVTYQWIDCLTGSSIINAQQKTFSPEHGGIYAVIINNGICSDTSSCYPFLANALKSISQTENNTIYPNPFTKSIFIANQQFKFITIYSAQGVNILSQEIKEKKMEIHLDFLMSGLYFIKIDNSYFKVFKR